VILVLRVVFVIETSEGDTKSEKSIRGGSPPVWSRGKAPVCDWGKSPEKLKHFVSL